MNKKALQLGINLGGWISQYPAYDPQHFKTFITAEDIKRIAEWSMDHVRLPVDYPVLEEEGRPGNYKDSGFEYIESCLEWCQANGLRVVLDLHKAPGFAFDQFNEASLFNSPKMQDRFLDLWTAIASRFAARMEDMLAFELLNEIVLPDSSPWNQLVKRRWDESVRWILIA
jgi:endoglucanase